MKNARRIGYWITTSLLALAMLASAVGYLGGAMTEGLAKLGYGMAAVYLLGFWKLVGSIALMVPKLPRAKEWVYAGFFFNFTGAAVSHLVVGDGASEIVAPLVMLAVLVASYLLRPDSLWLGGSIWSQDPGATTS